MIDLTPLDVRNKRGDFDRNLRGYDSQEVDTFLELVAERLEGLVMENLQLRERSEGLQKQVDSQSGREKAVQEALVTAQELRSEMRSQAQRESDLILNEARTEARRLLAEAEADVRTLLRDTEVRLDEGESALKDLERRRLRFLKGFRQLLEREMDVVEVEEDREPLEARTIELSFGGGRRRAAEATPAESRSSRPPSSEAEVAEPDSSEPASGEADSTHLEPSDKDGATLADDDLMSAATQEVRDILAGLGPEGGEEGEGWVPGPDPKRSAEHPTDDDRRS